MFKKLIPIISIICITVTVMACSGSDGDQADSGYEYWSPVRIAVSPDERYVASLGYVSEAYGNRPSEVWDVSRIFGGEPFGDWCPEGRQLLAYDRTLDTFKRYPFCSAEGYAEEIPLEYLDNLGFCFSTDSTGLYFKTATYWFYFDIEDEIWDMIEPTLSDTQMYPYVHCRYACVDKSTGEFQIMDRADVTEEIKNDTYPVLLHARGETSGVGYIEDFQLGSNFSGLFFYDIGTGQVSSQIIYASHPTGILEFVSNVVISPSGGYAALVDGTETSKPDNVRWITVVNGNLGIVSTISRESYYPVNCIFGEDEEHLLVIDENGLHKISIATTEVAASCLFDPIFFAFRAYDMAFLNAFPDRLFVIPENSEYLDYVYSIDLSCLAGEEVEITSYPPDPLYTEKEGILETGDGGNTIYYTYKEGSPVYKYDIQTGEVEDVVGP